MIQTLNYMIDAPHCMPKRGHEEDAGLDLRAKEETVIPAHGAAVVDTGARFEIPKGYYGKLESKSGLNVKHGVVSLGGVIDSGYTGSVLAKLYNMTDTDYTFHKGDKVVQIIFQAHACPRLVNVTEFSDSNRGENGFGSTGK